MCEVVRYPQRTGRYSLGSPAGSCSLSTISGSTSASCEVEPDWARYLFIIPTPQGLTILCIADRGRQGVNPLIFRDIKMSRTRISGDCAVRLAVSQHDRIPILPRFYYSFTFFSPATSARPEHGLLRTFQYTNKSTWRHCLKGRYERVVFI